MCHKNVIQLGFELNMRNIGCYLYQRGFFISFFFNLIKWENDLFRSRTDFSIITYNYKFCIIHKIE